MNLFQSVEIDKWNDATLHHSPLTLKWSLTSGPVAGKLDKILHLKDGHVSYYFSVENIYFIKNIHP